MFAHDLKIAVVVKYVRHVMDIVAINIAIVHVWLSASSRQHLRHHPRILVTRHALKTIQQHTAKSIWYLLLPADSILP